MLITIMTVGSRGDVQPMVALGRGLRQHGLEVRLATHSLFADLARENDLEFAPLEGNPQALLEQREGAEWLRSQHSLSKMAGGFRQLMGPVIRQCFKDGLEAAAGSDAIIFSGPAYYFAHSIAQKLGIPFIQAYLQPIHPTGAFPSALFPAPFSGGRIYNYATHVIAGMTFWQLLRPVVNEARREFFGLPGFSWRGPFLDLMHQAHPVVYGYSPAIVPKPANWGDYIHVSGFWFLDQPDWRPSAELEAFLAGGPPPVYVGFGSMNDGDPQRMTETVLKALDLSGQRGVLLTGWGGLHQTDLPEQIFKIDHAAHEWLFPRMAAVVHHGGAGTTAAGLRAGVPGVLIPFFGDQPFWAAQIHRLGLGPRPIARAKLSAAGLAGAIDRAVGDEAMRRRASAMGDVIRAEDGVGRACAIIAGYLQKTVGRQA
jgi:sterol 3beta-glucosyltransferase